MVSYRGGYRPNWTTGSFATCSGNGKTALRIACISLNQADPSTLQRGTLRVLQHSYTRSSIQRRITFLFPPDMMSNHVLQTICIYVFFLFERELFVCMMWCPMQKLLNLLPYFTNHLYIWFVFLFHRKLFVCMNFEEAWSHQPLAQVSFHT